MKIEKKEKHLINIMVFVLAILLVVYVFVKSVENKSIQTEYATVVYTPDTTLLHVKNGKFFENGDTPIHLTGINLGQWLVLEGYLWGVGNHERQTYQVNYSERELDEAFLQIFNPALLSKEQFITSYRENFITEKDFVHLKSLGVNFVRIPFPASDFISFFERRELREENFTYWDKSLEWCNTYKIYCLFDMHAAILPQSTFSHANSSGEATFWDDMDAQEKTTLFWTAVSRRYNGNPYLAGFDLLNEPQAPSDGELKQFYEDTVRALRKTGFQHLIFLQPNNVSLDIDPILLEDKGIVYEPHFYGFGTKARSENEILFSQKKKHNVPVMIGEVGNWANDAWAKNSDVFVLYRFLREGIPITYWNYKDMIADNSKSFGLVSGDTGTLYQQFLQALELGEKLDAHFDWNTLFQNFQTKLPTDRPYVEDIIRRISPSALIDVFSSVEEAEKILKSESTIFPYTERSTQYMWDLSQEFLDCDAKTVAVCFGIADN